MPEHRRRILQMLAECKINADEAERLISALEREPAGDTRSDAPSAPHRPAKYLRVVVDTDDTQHGGEGPTKVNIRVPMQLLRAGVRLSALIPPQARDEVDARLREQGVPFSIGQIRPENLEALVEQLDELTVDVHQERTKVRVFCE